MAVYSYTDNNCYITVTNETAKRVVGCVYGRDFTELRIQLADIYRNLEPAMAALMRHDVPNFEGIPCDETERTKQEKAVNALQREAYTKVQELLSRHDHYVYRVRHFHQMRSN